MPDNNIQHRNREENPQPSAQNVELNLRSDEVQEIMSHVPNWMIRWGITLIFALILLGLFITWFIKYPDVIVGNVNISTEQKTTKLVTKSSGEIVYLKNEGERVKEGELIGTIKTVLSPEGKEFLFEITQQIELAERTNKFDLEFNDHGLVFGSLHESYEALKKSVLDYQYFMENNSSVFEIGNLKEQIHNHTVLRSVTDEQLRAREKLLKQAQERYASSERLYEQKAISKTQLFDEKEKFVLAESTVAETKKAVVQSSITITELKKQLRTLEVEFEKQKNDYALAIRSQVASIQNALSNWENAFEFRASIDGELAYLENIAINQFVESGKELFAVIPDDQEFLGHVVVPKQGYGKLKIGQKVRVKLDNYPYMEYGQLEGVVKSISLVPNKDSYRVDFSLENGLESSYGKEFKYTPEMSGVAEIITEDLRLIERVFNQFRKVLD